ncbi:unnamed protein product, partial [Cuscuta epithymum]
MGSSTMPPPLMAACGPVGFVKGNAKSRIGRCSILLNLECKSVYDYSRIGSAGKPRRGSIAALNRTSSGFSAWISTSKFARNGFSSLFGSSKYAFLIRHFQCNISNRPGKVLGTATHHANDIVSKEKSSIKERRVVLTGMGVVSPLGHEPNEFYGNLLEGVSGINEIEAFDCSQYST